MEQSAPNQTPEDSSDSGHTSIEDECPDIAVTSEEVLNALEKPFNGRELLFADMAVAIGTDSGVFKRKKHCKTNKRQPVPASEKEMELLQIWEVEMKNLFSKTPKDNALSPEDDARATLSTVNHSTNATYSIDPEVNNVVALNSACSWSNDKITLNERQSMVHNIITNQLQ